MPTGYTAAIEEDDVTFEEFVWMCARGMGGLMHMREDLVDAPIRYPEKSDYYTERLKGALDDLKRIAEWTGEEQRAEMEAEHKSAMATYEDRLKRTKALEQKYQTMLDKVRAWEPPSDDHVGLKEFMREQIISSINFDCHEPHKPELATDVVSWYTAKLNAAKKDVERCKEGLVKEEERIRGTSAWIDALAASVPIPKKYKEG